jgi:hypothetical protein
MEVLCCVSRDVLNNMSSAWNNKYLLRTAIDLMTTCARIQYFYDVTAIVLCCYGFTLLK